MAAGMVGRDGELVRVLRSLTAAGTSLTLVVGEAGIGKSRLVAEVVRGSGDRLTLSGGCLPMRHALPLLPVVDALDTPDPQARRVLSRAARRLPRGLGPHLAGVMPRTLPTEIAPPEEVRRDQVFLACQALLSQAAEERPITLVVEDVHWADPDTLDLLTFLAGGRHSDRLHLLVTCRSDEVRTPETVATWLETHRDSPSVSEMQLGPLPAAEVRRLVAALPHPSETDPDHLTTLVLALSDGNPFFTEQLVAAGPGAVPRALSSFLSARVKAVTAPAQDALTALAVLGRPVPVGALRMVTQQGEETCVNAVHELEAASLVLRSGPHLRMRHALLAEAILDALPVLPAHYRRRVASALEMLGDPSTAPEIAEHLRHAGDTEGELGAAMLAAQRAWDLGAYTDAARWYRRIADLHARYPGLEKSLPEAEIARRILRALHLGGSRVDATSYAGQVLRDFAHWPNNVERLALLRLCADLVMREDGERGLKIMQDVVAQYEQLPPTREHAEALSRLANHVSAHGDDRIAVGLLRRALTVLETLDEPAIEAMTLARLSICLRQCGKGRAAEKHATTALRTALRSADKSALLFVLDLNTDNPLKFAQFESAVTLSERAARFAIDEGLEHSFTGVIAVANAAEAHLALGHIDRVGALVDVDPGQPPHDDDLLGALRAQVQLRRGDPEGALAWLRRKQDSRLTDLETPRQRSQTLVEVLLWLERASEALNVVVDDLPEVTIGDQSQYAGQLLSLGARAAADLAHTGNRHASEQGLRRLEELRYQMRHDPFAVRDTLPRGAVDGLQWHAESLRATGRSDPIAWSEAARGWQGMLMGHDAAYCWWRAAQALQATRGPKTALREALHAAHRLAEQHALLRREVTALAARARIPIAEAPSPATADPARKKGLTDQETKVLRLVAAGLTNAEIGTALYITPKTASIHVSNLLRKLQVTNRTEAAAWAIHHGFDPDQ